MHLWSGEKEGGGGGSALEIYPPLCLLLLNLLAEINSGLGMASYILSAFSDLRLRSWLKGYHTSRQQLVVNLICLFVFQASGCLPLCTGHLAVGWTVWDTPGMLKSNTTLPNGWRPIADGLFGVRSELWQRAGVVINSGWSWGFLSSAGECVGNAGGTL